MRARYPELKTSLVVANSTTLISDVAAGRLDAAVVAEHVGFPPALRWSPFLCEPLWLVAPPGTEIEGAAQALATLPFVRFQSPVPLANLIDTELSRLGVVTQDVAAIDTIGAIMTCVRQGLGISVVPHVALQEPENEALVRIPFGEPQLTRRIGLVERQVSTRGEIIERIHGALVELCGSYGVQRSRPKADLSPLPEPST
ncbi:DNA-binding transcriptional LysR family regulator [Limimaricola variabilis]|uniref:DNA-binding transcriptional LysR family regulator n=1 Tax=Limimaricola variabilis TaxID=1492771 RepID=A0ABR6HR97_9RHOB|nr:LysR substrate-binding domain-containing protein [Limimaricola variabilis]MBB3713064.1 DNA-binding transcriptional LysR family regulator [Limimaricola variabilis]